jgi:hypothetical protein
MTRNDEQIIKTMTFEIPLAELKGWRHAARSRNTGVVRWLRDLAEADIQAIKRGVHDEQ